jgi:hypothetical protein
VLHEGLQRSRDGVGRGTEGVAVVLHEGLQIQGDRDEVERGADGGTTYMTSAGCSG